MVCPSFFGYDVDIFVYNNVPHSESACKMPWQESRVKIGL